MKAVRNRKELFKKLLHQYTNTVDYQVLNVASGPCRDVAEYLQNNPTKAICIDCLEHDSHAIDYAKTLLQSVNSDQYQFIHANIFKFDTTKEYDFIWSAGLFDYFDDMTFIKVLK
ncbi:MAG: class I SAM-dependent methyltransferase [Bacteroidota bacterium]